MHGSSELDYMEGHESIVYAYKKILHLVNAALVLWAPTSAV